jgi:hypothetical protein
VPRSGLDSTTDIKDRSRDVRLVPKTEHPRINSSLTEVGIARPRGDKLSERPSESPTYCSTPAAANYRTSSRPHLVRVRELGRVGTLRSTHLPVPILRRYARCRPAERSGPAAFGPEVFTTSFRPAASNTPMPAATRHFRCERNSTFLKNFQEDVSNYIVIFDDNDLNNIFQALLPKSSGGNGGRVRLTGGSQKCPTANS